MRKYQLSKESGKKLKPEETLKKKRGRVWMATYE